MASSSRRAVLRGVAALPALTLPAFGGRSDLALACDFGIRRLAYINGSHEPWDDERLTAECEKVNAVFRRAIAEPSASMSDIAAKSRLMLDEIDNDGREPAQYDDERMIETILREIVAFEAQAQRGRL